VGEVPLRAGGLQRDERAERVLEGAEAVAEPEPVAEVFEDDRVDDEAGIAVLFRACGSARFRTGR
jgi:hypothetical protein